ncbi:hypothetical protein HDE_11067 [Halotydeus destructor]|nr:hypothetical protein HDE_11067 [Halotydeus destructor]
MNTFLDRAWPVIWFLFCTAGCLYQVYDRTSLYLEYQTSRLVKILLPETILPPNLALCLRYAEILDKEQYIRDFNMRSIDFAFLDANLTIEEYFKYTPEPFELIENCGVRRNFLMDIMNVSQCRTQLRVTKTYVQQYVCYLISWRYPAFFKYQAASRALTHTNEMYFINFNTTRLRQVRKFNAILHYGKLPDKDADLATPITRVIDDVNNRTSNVFEIDYFYVRNTRLPLPYDTECINYTALGAHYEDQLEAIAICNINNTLEALDKVPFTNMISTPYQKRHISNKDILNKTVMNQVEKVEDDCERRFARADCRGVYLSCETSISAGQTFRITATVPNSSCYDVATTVVLTLSAYLIFVCSCLNICFCPTINAAQFDCNLRYTMETALYCLAAILATALGVATGAPALGIGLTANLSGGASSGPEALPSTLSTDGGRPGVKAVVNIGDGDLSAEAAAPSTLSGSSRPSDAVRPTPLASANLQVGTDRTHGSFIGDLFHGLLGSG